jgi:ActR/RegA family two-component response regulator
MDNNRRNIRLLIVDDDKTLRETLAGRFQRQGITVVTATDVAAALSLAKSRTLDVALLDLHLNKRPRLKPTALANRFA